MRRLSTDATWTMVQDYSRTNTWIWNITGFTAGTYDVLVYVRNVGSPLPYEAYKVVSYRIQ